MAGGFLGGVYAFRKVIESEYELHPDLKPFSDGDRAGMLGKETAQAFAIRKWTEQAKSDRNGRPHQRGPNPAYKRNYRPGITLREPTAAQCPRELSGHATLSQAVHVEQGSTDQATVLDVPRQKRSDRVRFAKGKRSTVRVGEKQRRTKQLTVERTRMPWWRSVVGILAGGAQAYSGGLDWKHVLAGLGIAALGVVSHLTSTSGKTWQKVQ